MYKQIEENIEKLEKLKKYYLELVSGFPDDKEKRYFYETMGCMSELIGKQTQQSYNKGVLYMVTRELDKWQSILQELDKIIDKYEGNYNYFGSLQVERKQWNIEDNSCENELYIFKQILEDLRG